MRCSYNKTVLKAIEKNLPGYKCDKYLGSGAFGKTYRIKKGASVYALKIIEDPDDFDINEVKVLKKLKDSCSKKKVVCYDKFFSDDKSRTYIMTEYIDGSDLKNYIEKEYIYKYISQLIEAVKYIHSKNIVHFDIKPANIMITKDNNLKLIDFGGASHINKKGYFKITAYTPFYAPVTNYFNDVHKGMLTEKEAKNFDWYTVVTTVLDTLSRNMIIDRDLSGFYMGQLNNFNPKKGIVELKKIIKNKKPLEPVKKIQDKVPDDKILNPKTGRYVLRTGKIGMALIK